MQQSKNISKRYLLHLIAILLMVVLMIAKCSGGGHGNQENGAIHTAETSSIETSELIEASTASSFESNGIETMSVPDAELTTTPELGEDAQAESDTEPEPEEKLAPWELFKPFSTLETNPYNEEIGYRHEIQINGAIIDEFVNPDEIFFGMPESYGVGAGITTFRGNNFRNNASFGYAEIEDEKLMEIYRINIGNLQHWTGVGWSGQPAIVKWDYEVQQMMNLYPEKRDKEDLIEVIQGAVDGNVYFFDLYDGVQTRPPLKYGEAIKGGISIDPRGYPILYIGQGDQFYYRTGFAIYSLLDCKELYFLTGHDPFSPRYWGLFDSNPLFDVSNDRMFLCGENGVIYNIKLNTEFNAEDGILSIAPEIYRYRYTSRINTARSLGMESSPSIFNHFLFVADSGGLVQCLDLMTYQPVWARDCTDDTDASIVLDWEEENMLLALYTGSQTDYQSNAYLRKLNAENGELLWEHSYPCLTDTSVSGGLLATPVTGKGDISDLVVFWVGKVTGRSGYGALVAFDKVSGEVVWENIMAAYGWSSPVALYTEDGRGYLIVCDAVGRMYLIRGRTGELLDTIHLGTNIEASPAAYGNFIVVGTRGQQIFGIRVS